MKKVGAYFRPDFFDDPVHRDIAKIVLGLYKQYKRLPTPAEIAEEFHEWLGNNPKKDPERYQAGLVSVLDATKKVG